LIGLFDELKNRSITTDAKKTPSISESWKHTTPVILPYKLTDALKHAQRVL
jgi:hypothetical protein